MERQRCHQFHLFRLALVLETFVFMQNQNLDEMAGRQFYRDATYNICLG